jgi:hypothetical protein
MWPPPNPVTGILVGPQRWTTSGRNP